MDDTTSEGSGMRLMLMATEERVGRGPATGLDLPYVIKDGIPVLFEPDHGGGVGLQVPPPGTVGVRPFVDGLWVVDRHGDAHRMGGRYEFAGDLVEIVGQAMRDNLNPVFLADGVDESSVEQVIWRAYARWSAERLNLSRPRWEHLDQDVQARVLRAVNLISGREVA